MSREIFIISDTHFNHANIIRYCDRPFKDVGEMNERMIENWNKVVTPQDIVYHLGDVYFSKHWKSKSKPELDPPKDDRESYAEQCLARLNGKKRLIGGNHDNLKDPILQKYFKKIGIWRQFTEFGLLLTHVPVHESCFNEGKVGESRKFDVNVHGHVHQNSLRDKRYKNVSVEMINYTPITFIKTHCVTRDTKTLVWK
jgi:calcineurin-like phosphoesterase family protein